jgi:hypothetical protein
LDRRAEELSWDEVQAKIERTIAVFRKWKGRVSLQMAEEEGRSSASL